jgi:hypothetical protein
MITINSRKGCPKFITETQPKTEDFVTYVKPIPIIYHETKLTHSGITTYKVFENCFRTVHKNSSANLIQNRQEGNNLTSLFPTNYNNRHLNATQSRKIKTYSQKLTYYSKVRKIHSSRTGSYKYKVSFLTLTTPENATPTATIKAFEHFLDYLRRTAHCVYVWKKELGEKNNHLHFHIIINNFIPFYIVAWKWKRLLIAEGIEWPKNEKGIDTSSHYRIELPRSKRLIAYYIAKYMSKAYELPKEYGYISGHSEILEELKEIRFIETELPVQELQEICKHYKTIQDTFVTHTCVDLLTIKDIAPVIHDYFLQQYKGFEEMITQPENNWNISKKMKLPSSSIIPA